MHYNLCGNTEYELNWNSKRPYCNITQLYIRSVLLCILILIFYFIKLHNAYIHNAYKNLVLPEQIILKLFILYINLNFDVFVTRTYKYMRI